MSSATQSSSASLLGIPAELRLNIYTHVFQQNLDTRPLEAYKLQYQYPPHPDGALVGFINVIDIRRTEHTRFNVSWLNLSLSCKSISEEIQDYMESSSFMDVDENRTYEMDLKPQGDDKDLVTVSWRRLPCPPHKLRKLVIHNNGAAATIMTSLNLFFHCGVSMDRRFPLKEHLKLEELVVKILSPRALVFPEQISGLKAMDGQGWSRPEFELVHRALLIHHYKGELKKYLRKFCICGLDGQYVESNVGISWPRSARH